MDKIEEFAKTIAYMIETLANNKRINVTTLLSMCGLPRSTVYNMKNGRVPNADKLFALAQNTI